jgi:hypothetical protein
MTIIALTSCKTIQAKPPRPALLEHSSPEIRIVLEQAVGSLMNSQPIKLADNVFTQKSTIIVESLQAKDSRGNMLDGREIRRADTVSLLVEDGKCYVRHDQSGHITLLINISCKPKLQSSKITDRFKPTY